MKFHAPPLGLLTMRAYARRTGVNVSTISRQVADGTIPVVYARGRRWIDPFEADQARYDCLHPWWGGKRERLW
jgi:hypothetical protein